jgi:hypothetical protein
MWQGTVDFADGKFYEPRFYGQPYNTMLESFLAVPFYKLGVPLKYGLPLISVLLSLFPYFILARVAFNRRSQITGILILAFVLLMPVTYDLITTLSRGFVPGIAVAGLLFLFLFKKLRKIEWVFIGFIAVISYSVNANSVLISIPVLLYLWLQHIRNGQFYVFGLIGILLGVTCHFFIQYFYVVHPKVALHNYQLEFSWSYLKQGLSNFGLFFDNVIPVFNGLGWLMIPTSILTSIIFFSYKKPNEACVALSIPLLMIFPLLISKVSDGNDSVFFSVSRMYLGIPLVWVLLLSFIDVRSLRLTVIILLGSLGFAFYKATVIDFVIDKELKKNTVVGVMKNDDLISECERLSRIAKKYNVDLIVIIDHWNYDFYNYGCAECVTHFPTTIRPSYDRRIWRLKKVASTMYSNILFIDLNRDLASEFGNIVKLPLENGFYLIKGNKTKTIDLFTQLNLTIREF